MYTILQTRYARVERALDSLLDSITAYNPSPAAADELVAADTDVNLALEQLQTHHANHAHLLSLRSTSAALDEQIKATLRSLAAMRSSLKAIALPAPSSGPAEQQHAHQRPVKVADLLAYAKFISKTSVPPTRRAVAPEPQPQQQQAGVKTEPTTPAAATAVAAVGTGGAGSAGQTPAEDAQQQQQGRSEAMRRVLPPEVKGQFIPWPSHEVIRAGALAAVQAMLEAGKDPGAVTRSAEEEAAMEEERKVEEERRKAAEEEERAERERRRREGQGAAAQVARRREDAVYTEDVFDPDEM